MSDIVWGVRCMDCDAEFVGTLSDAEDSGWIWVTDSRMDCPDCADELYPAETVDDGDSSATIFEIPEWV